jgi:hypothetical protein
MNKQYKNKQFKNGTILRNFKVPSELWADVQMDAEDNEISASAWLRFIAKKALDSGFVKKCREAGEDLE